MVCTKTFVPTALAARLVLFLPVVGFAAGSPLQSGPADVRDSGRFPDVLVEPTEILPGDRIPLGTFRRTGRDLVETTGREFAGPPPKSAGFRIRYAGQDVVDAGAWNNATIDLLRNVGPNDQSVLLEAARRFQAGLRGDPQFFPFLYNLGRTFLLLNRPREALRFLTRARGVLREFPGVYVNLGRAHAMLKEDHAVEESYRIAARLNPFDPQPLVELGTFFLEQGSPVKAGYWFSAVLRDHPDFSNAQIGMARLVLQSGQMVRARQMLKAVPTDYLDGTPRRDYDRILHYHLAVIAANLQDYAEAARQFERLLSEPDDPFFLSTPIADIKRRREIMLRLAAVQARK